MSLAKVIAEAAIEKQATDVVILDLSGLDAVTDCFVICTGGVNQQVRAIAQNIEKNVKEQTHDRLLHREGTEALNWVILDYVNVVAHVFKPSFREFYRLENLWGDAELIPVSDDAPRVRAKPAKRTAGIEAAPKAASRKAPVKKAAAPKKAPVAKKPAPKSKPKPKSSSPAKTTRSKITKSKS